MELYIKHAATLYPSNLQHQQEYLSAVKACQLSPSYYVMLPTGTQHPCVCEPLLNDKTHLVNQNHPEGALGSWQLVRKQVRRAPKRPREPSFEDYDE